MIIVTLIGVRARNILNTPTPPVDLHYSLSFPDPAAEQIHVELEIDGIESSTIHLSFSSNSVASSAPVSKFRVRGATNGDGKALSVIREDGAWKIKTSGSRARISYDVHLREGRGGGEFADELLSALDQSGGYLLGSDVFLFPASNSVENINVGYDMPEDWAVLHPFQSGEFTARYPNLRSLYYSAVAVGQLRSLHRNVRGTELVLASRGNFRFGDVDLMESIATLAEHQIDFFGETPRTRYVFVVAEHPDSDDQDQLHYFGLHFDASMTILLDSRTDRLRLTAEPSHIIAHEFFHNWNGELISQNDYAMNWFVEGVTTYYAYKSRLATHMLGSGDFAKDLSLRHQKQYLSNPRLGEISVAEAGRTVLQDSMTTQLLYVGGTFVALALDEEIGRLSRHRISLDDVLRDLASSARADAEFRLTRKSLEESLSRLTGSSFHAWLESYAYGVETLTLPEYVTATRAR
jgi:predicted metalloprotease with PDZ domain